VNDSKHHRANAQLWRLRFGGKPDSWRRAVRLAAGGLAVLLMGGVLVWLPKPAAYGRWGFDTSTIDPTVRPGHSFFDYANGTWAARFQIDAYSAGINMSGVIKAKVRDKIRYIVTKAFNSNAAPDTDTGKIAALYRAFNDHDRRERLDLAPIAGELAEIRNAATRTDIAILMGRSLRGFGKSLFDMWVQQDERDPGRRHALYVAQHGLGLPDRDYYLRSSFADKKAAYRDYIARLLYMAGWPDAGQRADEIVAFETRIAEASWSNAERRDPDRTYNRMTAADLDALAPGFPWPAWLDAGGVGGVRVVVVREKSAFPRLAQIFADTPVATLQAWQAFHVVDDAARYLSYRVVNAAFDFQDRTLRGQSQNSPAEERALFLVDNLLGDAVGREYVALTFSSDTRSKVEALAGRLKQAMRERIENLSWMAPATKARALEKLDDLRFKIGYPDKWRDYAALTIDPEDLVGNVRRASAFRWSSEIATLDKPVDPLAWTMTPQSTQVGYDRTRNAITVPAAMLQPPFFDPNADPAINYGAIGGFIGHEITHAFDDRGRKYDGHGMLVDWWQPQDNARFLSEAARLRAQYDAYKAAPGLNVNGAQTMGENIADLGGVLLALDAWRASLNGAAAPVLGGFTGEQRFFLGWAQIWRAKYSPDFLKLMVTSDVHPPARFRVDGPLRNIDAWYDAYGVRPGDTLYLPPEQRVRMW
jgi:putative endopeptidase